MSALKELVERHNRNYGLFGLRPLFLDNSADRQKIANNISDELSPENLTCDGEATMAQIRKKSKMLTAAMRELRELDPTVKFD